MISAMEPTACLLKPTLPTGPEWLYEIKLDGYRAIGTKQGRRRTLQSRRAKSFTSAMGDGEVIAFDAEGRPSFQLLQNVGSRGAPLAYFLFDLLELDRADLRPQPFTTRRRLLEGIMPTTGPIRLSPALPDEPEALMRTAGEQGFEGIVAKRKDSRYETGERSGAWVKWKAERSSVFLIGGYVPAAAPLTNSSSAGARAPACAMSRGFGPAFCPRRGARSWMPSRTIARSNARSINCREQKLHDGGRNLPPWKWRNAGG
jgi:bifunctional non-homologous end joining protein LigD